MCNDHEWERLRRFIADQNLTPDAVLITHCHTDHVMGVGYLTKAYPGISVYGSMEDQNHLPSLMQQNMLFGVDVELHYSPITRNLCEGDKLCLPIHEEGNYLQHRILVIDCPGHSHHGLCYYFPEDKILFSGDVLFAGSVGRSDFGPNMGCNGRLLLEGIVSKLFVLPSDVKVYPGHGMHTTIGYEQSNNPYV